MTVNECSVIILRNSSSDRIEIKNGSPELISFLSIKCTAVMKENSLMTIVKSPFDESSAILPLLDADFGSIQAALAETMIDTPCKRRLKGPNVAAEFETKISLLQQSLKKAHSADEEYYRQLAAIFECQLEISKAIAEKNNVEIGNHVWKMEFLTEGFHSILQKAK